MRSLATIRDRSAHELMRQAIRQYVDREEAREGLKQEAHAAWTAYQETGKHLTGQEARAWLSTWGTENEAQAPECHR